MGATVRWLATRSRAPGTEGGWFAYAPNTSVSFTPDRFSPNSSSEVIATASGIPWDTLLVNVAGCLILGALTFALGRSVGAQRRSLVAAASGFCGSLTTFSTFAVEVAVLLRGRPVLPAGVRNVAVSIEGGGSIGGVGEAATYLTVSLICGGVAFALGHWSARAWSDR